MSTCIEKGLFHQGISILIHLYDAFKDDGNFAATFGIIAYWIFAHSVPELLDTIGRQLSSSSRIQSLFESSSCKAPHMWFQDARENLGKAVFSNPSNLQYVEYYAQVSTTASDILYKRGIM